MVLGLKKHGAVILHDTSEEGWPMEFACIYFRNVDLISEVFHKTNITSGIFFQVILE